jgi:DNA-binding winged helix-turn-helix (wHTH) protein
MTYRFGDFALDVERRELRRGVDEVVVQPLVFDFLAYLIRHRDRVVGKQELLEELWDDALVVDGALQRVVSLARSALRSGGAAKAIRTYARRGYRFCGEVETTGAPADSEAGHGETVSRARAHFDRGEWQAAIEAFRAADGEQELDGPDLEAWARAITCTGRLTETIPLLERAVATYALHGDRRGAGRAALALAITQFERREMAVSRGWLNRAGSFLEGLAEGPEHATREWVAGRTALIDGDLDASLQHSESALEIGRRLGSTDHEALGLMYSGHALIARGELEPGVARQDEAAAAVLAGAVSPWTGGQVYCGVIWACRNMGDWKRAAEWTVEFTRWCRESPVSSFPGTCQLHRAEVLSVSGELAGAAREAAGALEMLADSAPWAMGDAHRVLGDILLLRGDLAAAEREFKTAHAQGWDPQPGYAMLLDARGETGRALRSLQRSLEDPGWSNRQRRPLLLAQLAILSARAGEVEMARRAVAELETTTRHRSSAARTAIVQRARGELAEVEGRRDDALAHLRDSLRAWSEVGSPAKAAELRLRLAEVYLQGGDADAAELEVSAAESTAQRLRITPMVDRCVVLRDRIDAIGGAAGEEGARS